MHGRNEVYRRRQLALIRGGRQKSVEDPLENGWFSSETRRPASLSPILSRYSTVGGIRYIRILYIYTCIYNAIGPPRGLLQP